MGTYYYFKYDAYSDVKEDERTTDGERTGEVVLRSVREGLSKEVTVESFKVEKEPEVGTFQGGIIIAVNTM